MGMDERGIGDAMVWYLNEDRRSRSPSGVDEGRLKMGM